MHQRTVFFLLLAAAAAILAFYLYRENDPIIDPSTTSISTSTGTPPAPRRAKPLETNPTTSPSPSAREDGYPLLRLKDAITGSPIGGVAVYAESDVPKETRSKIGRTNALGEFKNAERHDKVVFVTEDLIPPIEAQWTRDASLQDGPTGVDIEIPYFAAVDVTTSSVGRVSALAVEVIPYPAIPGDGSINGDALARLQHLRSNVRAYFKFATELGIVHTRIEQKSLTPDQETTRLLLPHTGRVVIAGASAGFLRRFVVSEIRQGEVTEASLPLSRSPMIRGTVRDAEQRPVPRKAVTIAVKKFYADDDLRVSDDSAATIWSQFRDRRGSRALTFLTAQTDEDGVFQRRSDEADSVAAAIIDCGFGRAVATKDQPDSDGCFLGLDLVLSKCKPRILKTTLAGADLPNVRLAIVQVDPVDEFSLQNPLAATDASGTIDLSFLDTGVQYSAMIVGRPDIDGLQFKIDGRSTLDFGLRK